MQSNDLRKTFLIKFFNRTELIGKDVEIGLLPFTQINTPEAIKTRTPLPFLTREFEEIFKSLIMNDKCSTLYKETFYINMLYQDAIYQVRLKEDIRTNPQTVIQLFKEFEEYSLQFEKDFQKKFHLVVISDFLLKFMKDSKPVQGLGFWYNKKRPWVCELDQAKASSTQRQNKSNRMIIFSL